MDKLFRVEVISRMPYPQTVIWAAMHQDYAEGFVADEMKREGDSLLPMAHTEEECGNLVVKHLLAGNRGHFGPLEHPQIVLSCGWFPHSVMQQVRTHRVGISFDVQCLSGDSVVTFVDCEGSSSPKLKKTMSELYDLWVNGESAIRERKIRGRNGEAPGRYRRNCKKRIRKMRVRSLDESSNTFTENHIEDIVFNGLNPVYKVTLADGKALKCTQNHKILTPYGWRILGQLSVGLEVIVNGQPLANAKKTYQNKEWLSIQFSQGLTPRQVAAIAGCSTEAIKKWAYHHNLTWQKQGPWNKGLSYALNISDTERQRRRDHAIETTKRRIESGLIPSGPDHPSWKDLPTEKRVYNWLKTNRRQILEEKGAVCVECGAAQKLHIHHIESVADRPDIAFEKSNLEVLCASCHTRHHKIGKENPLCGHPVKIISIEYVGVEPTYDLVMQAPHHNFVADGIVVHNSGRYTGKRILGVIDPKASIHDYEAKAEEVFYLRPVGFYTDRQGKRYEYTEPQRRADLNRCVDACIHYRDKIQQGFSEEHARSMIPFDVRQHFVVSCNVRSLMHLLDLRAKSDAQLECQQLCELIWPHFENWVPSIAAWYKQNRWGKARLSP